MKNKKNHCEFSKVLLKQESTLIWILSISYVILAFYCIYEGFTGSLPWLAAMVGFPWTAYGVSQAMYYRKSMAENTEGGIKYESVLQEAQKIKDQYEQKINFNVFSSGVDLNAMNENSNSSQQEQNSSTQQSPSPIENPDNYQI